MVKAFFDLDELRGQYAGCALTIGNFDGVHRGHQQIVAQAGLLAAQNSAPVVVLTFDPHPLQLLRPDAEPARLLPTSEKIRRLGDAGAEIVVVARPTLELLHMEAAEFLTNIVNRRFAPAHIVEGPSFRFGRGRAGTPELLRERSADLGFELFIVESVRLQVSPGETVVVSSSMVRKLIADGLVHRAHLCLGHPHTLCAAVVQGHGRGREIGFPTVNLGGIEQLVPGEGVYAGVAEVENTRYAAAISIGTTPTFDGTTQQVEAHLLDCGLDLYQRAIRLEFWKHLRSQQRFDCPDALKSQIAQDVENVRSIIQLD